MLRQWIALYMLLQIVADDVVAFASYRPIISTKRRHQHPVTTGSIGALVLPFPRSLSKRSIKLGLLPRNGCSDSSSLLLYSSQSGFTRQGARREDVAVSSRLYNNARHQPVDDDKSPPAMASTAANTTRDIYYDPKTPIAFIAGQSALIAVAVVISQLAHLPNFGCGPTLQFTAASIGQGLLYTIPLALFAIIPDLLQLEDQFPALKNVTQATLRSVMTLLGGQWKPLTAVVVCTLLGICAGLGEEMLFRGLLQYELMHQLQLSNALAIAVSSVIFGALHAVTPLYATLAGVASLYFGYIYTTSEYNLAVPVVCHAVYDIGALLYAHWTLSRMSAAEQQQVHDWEPASSTTAKN